MIKASRREVLLGATTALATGMIGCRGAREANARGTLVTTPDAALAELRDGNGRFVAGKPTVRSVAEIDRISRKNAVTQKPFATILTCADSRVTPEIIFDQYLGDIFVVREAGNIATSGTNLGSLEYSQAVTGAMALVVLGHSGCGAVGAAFKGEHPGGNIDAIVAAIRPQIAGAKTLEEAIALNVKGTIAVIRTQSPLLAQAEKAGKIVIRGAVYDLESGVVSYLE
jgi:carbonic anhydrase